MADDHMGYHYYHHFQLFLLISCCLVLYSHALQFPVGDQEGWVVNPSEKYNDWAERLRFQVNDTLLFKYGKGESVLVVNRDDYDNCNTDKPIQKFDDGNTVFKFDRSGPFYFITGHKDNCKKGQKIVIVVLAIRNRSPSPEHTPAPARQTTMAPSSSSPPPIPSSVSSPPSTAPGPGSDIRSPTSPPGGSSATPAFTTSAVLFSTISLVLYGGLVTFI